MLYICNDYIFYNDYTEKNTMINKADTYLLENNVNPSYQRVKIMEYLLRKKNHPNIDMIFSDLKKEMPKLSKTTIYNTLKLFIKRNLVSPLTIEDNMLRYDADTKIHGHFKCINCGTITDINLDLKNMNRDQLLDYTIFEHHINFKGTCNKKSCNK